jgi:ATP-dependent DNA helicase RecG
MGEQNELKSRYMIVGTKWEENKKEDSAAAQESTQETAGSTQESTQETNKSTQEMILDEIRKHPFTTREKLAKVIGITPDGIKKQLDKMKKAKRIKHVGPTKGGHWEIITE